MNIFYTSLKYYFLLLLLFAFSANIFGQDTYTHTITTKTYDATPQTKTLSSVDWTLVNNGSYYGYDATKGQQVGSGGEKSRLMLAIKSLSVQAKASPTMIFDEIDTGISGEVANKVALLLKEIGKNHQIIAITHLPQVAAKAEHHYFVYKKIKEGRTITELRNLELEERIQAIATMLSQNPPSDSAIANARELLKAG